MCDEGLLEQYLENGELPREAGSRFDQSETGISVLFWLSTAHRRCGRTVGCAWSLTEERQYPAKFGAKVYKIGRDEQGEQTDIFKSDRRKV